MCGLYCYKFDAFVADVLSLSPVEIVGVILWDRLCRFITQLFLPSGVQDLGLRVEDQAKERLRDFSQCGVRHKTLQSMYFGRKGLADCAALLTQGSRRED